MADFALDIDQVLTDENGHEFEVVARAELTVNGELQYTVVSKEHADVRRQEQADREEQERLAAETEAAINTPPPAPTEDAAPAAASEEPETLQPKS